MTTLTRRQMLALLRQYFYAHLNETLAMLGELDQTGSQPS